MKKYKLFPSCLFLALALLFVNIQPMKVYADDPGDGPQGTSQKKDTPPVPPDVVTVILLILRML
ncbi:MAG: hypothetical protein L0226_10195 [Acidobacteria bacterium]|nr:hypothetical protein [Acidobacteriota bacterium]